MATKSEFYYGYRINTSSFTRGLPLPSLDTEVIMALQNRSLSEEEIKYLEKVLAKNKKASAQFQFHLNLYRQRQQENS